MVVYLAVLVWALVQATVQQVSGQGPDGVVPAVVRPHRRALSGITNLADVPTDPFAKVLHLCRYPTNAARSATGTDNGADTMAAAGATLST